MQVEVLVERKPSNGFRATAPNHPNVKAEAETEDAAINLLREQLSNLFRDARLVTIEVPVPADKPWMEAAGCLKDMPDQEEYWEALREYRRQVEADDSRL